MSFNYLGSNDNNFRDAVASAANLPSTGNNLGDKRYTVDTGLLYTWSGASWVLASSGGTASSVTVTNFPVTQPVSGTVAVSNFPSATSVQSTIETGTVAVRFGDVTSVPMNSLTTLTSYVAGGPARVKQIEVSGTNIATYTVLINGTVINKKNTFFGALNNEFKFSKGYQLASGDVVSVQAIHQRSTVGEFIGFILVLQDY